MSKSQRIKGKRGEREFLNALGGHLGTHLDRNLSQSRTGGCDSLSIPGVALEVKRQERLAIAQWWQQAVRQATEVGRVPVLAYRQSRSPRAVVVPPPWVSGNPDLAGHTCTIDIECFALLIQRSGSAGSSVPVNVP